MHFAWETKVDVRYAVEDRGNCFWQNKLSYNANEYKTYLLGLVFYKYLSDSYLSKAYDLMNDEKPDSLEEAQEKYLAHYFERLLKVLCLIGLGSFMPIISGIIMCQVWKR